MKISTFTGSLSSGHLPDNPTWYIDTCKRKLLFISSNADALRSNIQLIRPHLKNVDTIILSAGCTDVSRELQYFLAVCPCADFYLPRVPSEKYVLDINKKLNGYCQAELKDSILCRTHFTDDIYSIGQHFLIFGNDTQHLAAKEHRQSLLVQKSSHAVLFSNTDRTASSDRNILTSAQKLTRAQIKYIYDCEGGHLVQTNYSNFCS